MTYKQTCGACRGLRVNCSPCSGTGFLRGNGSAALGNGSSQGQIGPLFDLSVLFVEAQIWPF